MKLIVRNFKVVRESKPEYHLGIESRVTADSFVIKSYHLIEQVPRKSIIHCFGLSLGIEGLRFLT